MLKCAAALLVLAGCATSPENRVEVSIRNTTREVLVIKAGSGILGTSVVIPPGGSWSGWIDRRWIGGSAWVEVRPVLPK